MVLFFVDSTPANAALGNITVSTDQIVPVLGLVVVICLLLLLIMLNHQKKKVILQTARDLEKAEAKYRLLFQQSPISLWEEDFSGAKTYVDALLRDGVTDLGQYLASHPDALKACIGKIKITDVNAKALELYEMNDRQQLSTIEDILPQGSEWIIREEIVNLLTRGHYEITIEDRTLSGRELTLELRAVVAEGYETTWEKVYASVIDITEQTRLKNEKKAYEKQIQQSQKLEAIGSLAGGIAHDFNNILSPIMGRAELMLLDPQNSSVMREHCQRIVEASKRARGLVKQILTFSRKVEQDIQPVSLEHIVDEVVQFIRPTLPSTITLTQDITSPLPAVMADSTQLHQVVMNLVTNAFHAMEHTKGTLHFSLHSVWLDVADCFDENILPGRYLCLVVADTGHGIDKATLNKIFDPYFSTKAKNKGTGLGLSVVHGILRSYGGSIKVESTVGEGTRMMVYLPAVEIKDAPKVQRAYQGPVPKGNEHILLVDDEKAVAEVIKDMLERLGYSVTMRVSSFEALEAFRSLNLHIDMVITDLNMSHMTGLQLLSKIRKLRDDIPFLITTGFSEQFDNAKSTFIGVDGYVNKPVLFEELGHTVRTILDRAGVAAEQGARVTVYEKMKTPARKLRITGKGRCNLTNIAPHADFLNHFGRSGRFLRQAFGAFFSEDLICFFKDLGLDIGYERGGRVFPASGDAQLVARLLLDWVRAAGARIQTGTSVDELVIENQQVKGILCHNQYVPADKVILATGGASYPRTGSTGDGYRFAEKAGHAVVPIRPNLVPLLTDYTGLKKLEGLNLRNINARMFIDGKRKTQAFGELTFVKSGLGGPIILTLSAVAVDALIAGKGVRINIDLKPALDEAKLEARLLRDLQKRHNETMGSFLRGLLPHPLVQCCLEETEIGASQMAGQLSSQQRKKIRYWLKNWPFTITGFGTIEEAIITAGGVHTSEINPNTMESKKVKGLYVAGELLDIQADTGGYNLQAAFSTGWVAGKACVD
ncbi:MAG: hypothetical protein CSA26_11865 [Desulfobacterales bacterium]|nr:MAG: hypothetical protein CSA26_11865 [Desulfobacterales bacterium]